MRNIRDQLDLAELQQAKSGYILNARHPPMLHRAECDAVGAMHARAYKKIFFENYAEAEAFANEKYGPRWLPCGRCNPWAQ